MARISIADLEKPVALKKAVVEVFGGQAEVRQMTAAEGAEHAVFAAEKTDGGKVYYPYGQIAYIYRCLVNENGTKFFKDLDQAIDLLGKQSVAEVNKLYQECERVNVETDLTEENIVEAAKNSDAASSSENSSALQ